MCDCVPIALCAADHTVPDIGAGMSATCTIPLNGGGQLARMDPLNKLQAAVKVQGQACYFSLEVAFNCLLAEDGKLERQAYLAKWGQLGDANEKKFSIT